MEEPKIRDIMRHAQELIAKDERMRKQNQKKEEENHLSQGASFMSGGRRNSRGTDLPEDSKIYSLRESIDGVMNYKVNQKNADTIKFGRKIVDKESEVYEKLLQLPTIGDSVRRTDEGDCQKESLLFKAPAVRMSTFLAQRNVEKQEALQKLKAHNFEFQPPQPF